MTVRHATLTFALLACSHSPAAAPSDSDGTDIGPETQPAETAAVDSIAAEDNTETADTGPPKCPPGPFFVQVRTPDGLTDEFNHDCIPPYGTVLDAPCAHDVVKGSKQWTSYEACSKRGTSNEVYLLLNNPAAPEATFLLYTRSDGVSFDNVEKPDLVIHWTRNEPVGGVVEGDFAGDIRRNTAKPGLGEVIRVTGTFRLCHTPTVYAVD